MQSPVTAPAISLEVATRAVETTLATRRGRAPEIAPETRLEDLDMNSLDLAEVFITIQEDVGFELDPESANEIEVVADLTRLERL